MAHHLVAVRVRGARVFARGRRRRASVGRRRARGTGSRGATTRRAGPLGTEARARARARVRRIEAIPVRAGSSIHGRPRGAVAEPVAAIFGALARDARCARGPLSRAAACARRVRRSGGSGASIAEGAAATAGRTCREHGKNQRGTEREQASESHHDGARQAPIVPARGSLGDFGSLPLLDRWAPGDRGPRSRSRVDVPARRTSIGPVCRAVRERFFTRGSERSVTPRNAFPFVRSSLYPHGPHGLRGRA